MILKLDNILLKQNCLNTKSKPELQIATTYCAYEWRFAYRSMILMSHVYETLVGEERCSRLACSILVGEWLFRIHQRKTTWSFSNMPLFRDPAALMNRISVRDIQTLELIGNLRSCTNHVYKPVLILRLDLIDMMHTGSSVYYPRVGSRYMSTIWTDTRIKRMKKKNRMNSRDRLDSNTTDTRDSEKWLYLIGNMAVLWKKVYRQTRTDRRATLCILRVMISRLSCDLSYLGQRSPRIHIQTLIKLDPNKLDGNWATMKLPRWHSSI